MSDLSDLYQEVILDHNRRPRNFRAIDVAEPPGRGLQSALRRPADASTSQVDGDVITDVAFQGSGCAISKASASLMTDAVKGQHRGRGARAVRALSPDGDDAARSSRSRTSASCRCLPACASFPCA